MRKKTGRRWEVEGESDVCVSWCAWLCVFVDLGVCLRSDLQCSAGFRFPVSSSRFILNILPDLEYSARSSIFCHIFNILPYLQYSARSSIFCQICNILPDLQYSARSSIFCQIFNILPNLQYSAGARSSGSRFPVPGSY